MNLKELSGFGLVAAIIVGVLMLIFAFPLAAIALFLLLILMK